MAVEEPMMLLATLGLIAWALWRGAAGLAVGLMLAGFLVHLALALRLVRTLEGGVGGHAEWLRDTSVRPRVRRSPAWLVGLALILAGLALAVSR